MPTGESNDAHEFVDLVDDPLNDDGRFFVAYFLEQLRQRSLALVFLFDFRNVFLGGCGFFGEGQDLLEKCAAIIETSLVTLSQCLKSLS